MSQFHDHIRREIYPYNNIQSFRMIVYDKEGKMYEITVSPKVGIGYSAIEYIKRSYYDCNIQIEEKNNIIANNGSTNISNSIDTINIILDKKEDKNKKLLLK